MMTSEGCWLSTYMIPYSKGRASLSTICNAYNQPLKLRTIKRKKKIDFIILCVATNNDSIIVTPVLRNAMTLQECGNMTAAGKKND